MKALLPVFVFVFSISALHAQQPARPVTLAYYLAGNSYDPAITTPSEFLGFEVGEWHVTPEQALAYYRLLDSQTDRITSVPFAKSWEQRPLEAFIITSPKNHADLENIRQRHVKFSDPKTSGEVDASKEPLVIWQGFSVHGNEASGGNAALLYVYHLAASTDPSVLKQLDQTVVLVDPIINPDGFGRFANWVNSRRSFGTPNADPADAEHNEPWPRGRTNHYWFDLNRDWLPVVNPESKGRLAFFKSWMPNILTDHHEMGTNSTFFFQPGVPARTNPLTPKQTIEMTGKIGQFHAAFLDSIGSYYFTKESYDDFYYGKGSTYPDLQGAVGILFEQASSRGHRQESVNGILEFSFTIKNQLTTALSTLKAATELRKELLEHQTWFFKTAMDEAGKDPVQGFVFGDASDPEKGRLAAELLLRHQIEVSVLAKDIQAGGGSFQKGKAFVISAAQPQYRLVKALFSKATRFDDSLFYDISAWTLPLATDLPYAELDKKNISGAAGAKLESAPKSSPIFQSPEHPLAFLAASGQMNLHRFLSDLLEAGIRVKVLEETTGISGSPAARIFPAGSLLIPVYGQAIGASEITDFVKSRASAAAVDIYGSATGLALEGIDAGSPSALSITKPSIALMVGEGTVSNDAGELWHLLDAVQDISVTLLPIDMISARSLKKYNRIIMPNGTYAGLSKSQAGAIREWVRDGGVLVAVKGAISALISNELVKADYANAEVKPDNYVAYNQQEAFSGSQEVAGAIFEARIDATHPLGWGYFDGKVSLFRDHNRILKTSETKSVNPVAYSSGPQQAGWVSSAILKKIQNTAGASVHRNGTGRVILLADNPNFRSFFTGTNRMFLNAVFFGDLIRASSAEAAE